jgi:hypothetical protein
MSNVLPKGYKGIIQEFTFDAIMNSGIKVVLVV